LAVAAFIALMGLQVGAQAGGDDFKQGKEWKALNRYVGVWEDEVAVTVPEPKQGRGSNTTAWTLGDRFLQMKSKTDLDNAEQMHLFTYDPNRRAIRWWLFSSLGQASAATGSWDEATSTFTYKVEDTGPASVIITDHFTDDDHHEWKLIVKDADGKVVFETSGKATRQKK
jgi:hypothetical protein